MKITSKPSSTTKNKTGGWRTFIPKTDLKKCIGCGTCARICPENAIAMVKIKAKLKPKTDYDFCKGCALCAEECPVKAIVMELDKK
ncbi:pyruvate synthase [Candidatus Falkowbacteria bacterium CG11_big_fil_rev_8_21_14_0_20_39_10]|uniref:Pyruvate synthase n=1 Tax=Candidatus Falkowbacteria bacterium CG11_big_fil_rev_8_21_14_0_20_39_10 TaxID=1974570 RepID=A0A2M6K999_9BACT|nr:MAG: pyruvate synthase [Candidatus Falkowbacteria bacterium CG11_big_fil_rev_8_21_14_0_20_39_10]